MQYIKCFVKSHQQISENIFPPGNRFMPESEVGMPDWVQCGWKLGIQLGLGFSERLLSPTEAKTQLAQ
jgi:hypothetical protein